MTILEFPFRLPLTAEEFEHIPPIEGMRVELWEGNLDVSAAAQRAWHSLVMMRVAQLLKVDDRTVLTGIGVVLSPRTVREPDVSRFFAGVRPARARSQFAAADVDLVVEIVSPESQRRDRVIKPDEYAAARIPEFWLVEPDATDEDEAVINIFKLTASNSYVPADIVLLSKLESEAHS
jgi:Uma2 family endonuclease